MYFMALETGKDSVRICLPTPSTQTPTSTLSLGEGNGKENEVL